MFRWAQTPFELAWGVLRGKKISVADGRKTVFACPDCEMPVNEESQKTNVRIETVRDGRYCVDGDPCYILSCPWCYKVMNIGEVTKVDEKFIIAKKDAS